MIKNLFAAIGMTFIYTGQPINKVDTVTQDINTTTNPVTKSNIYNQYIINQNNSEIESAFEIATIEYNEINLNNTIRIKNRARSKTIRHIIDNEYYLDLEIITKIEISNISINDIDIFSYLNFPISSAISRNETTIYTTRLTSLTTLQNNFIEGTNYNDFTELNSLLLNTNSTDESEIEYTGNNYYTLRENQTALYYYTYIDIKYTASQIENNGVDLINNLKAIEELGYNINYTATINPSQYEVIDLPGFMFNILGMPFAWLSIAFDFTLFPGTPYAINISHILLGLLVSLIAIIIFRLVMRGR